MSGLHGQLQLPRAAGLVSCAVWLGLAGFVHTQRRDVRSGLLTCLLRPLLASALAKNAPPLCLCARPKRSILRRKDTPPGAG